MKKLIVVVIILGVAILMALTVPEKDKHKEAMMKAIKEYVDEEAANMGFADNGITKAGKNVLAKTIELVLSSKLEETNYVFFNTTHAKMGDKEKTLSVGLFGQVITFDKEMLREALEESAHEKAEAKAEKKRLKEEAKAEKKRLKEEAKAEKKRLKEEQKRQEAEAKAEKKRLKEEKKRQEAEAKAEKKRLKEEKKRLEEEAKQSLP